MEILSIRTGDGSFRELPPEELNPFRRRFQGRLITAGDQTYENARTIWNGMIDKRPALIARCEGADDVAAAVGFAREHKVLFSIRGGGHNVAGSALADGGLVIDLGAMREVRVDPARRRVRVEGGARLGDVDRETQAHGLAVPVGVVSATGIAGLTLHGGAGWLTRRHGLTIDNLASVEIVTADGRLQTASAERNADLFWAVRGGGGNFGAVTAFEFRLHPVGPRAWLSVPIYPLEQAEEVMGKFRDFMTRAPEELMALGVFWGAPHLPEIPESYWGKPVLILLGCYSGPPEKGEAVIAPLRSMGRPIADLSAPMDWTQLQQFLDADYPDGAFYYWKSIFMDHLEDGVLQALTEHAGARPSAISSIDVWCLGGAMGRVSPTATPFYRRDARFMLGIEANWEKREDADANIAWARAVYHDMSRFTRGGDYLNFPGFADEKADMLRGAYGPNLERLQAVKAGYDPGNLFRGMPAISPEAT